MEKKEYLKKTLREMKRDTAKALKAKEKPKIKIKQQKGTFKTGTKLATVIGNKAHQMAVQSENSTLYDSSGNAYANRMKNTR